MESNNNLKPINVDGIIHEHNRPAEGEHDISGWFVTEQLTADFGDDEGRPSEFFTLKRDYLVQFISNGWIPKGVQRVDVGGEWTRKIVEQGSSSSTSTSSSHSSSSASTSSSHSSSSASTSTSEQESGSTSSERTEGGDPYWYARARIVLQRRRMQSENVLKDILDSYVRQYNSGISNGDARYNEAVQLYAVMLNRTETEGNALLDAAKNVNVQGLFNLYLKSSSISSLTRTWNGASYSAQDLKKAVEEGADIETRIKFENLIAKTRAQMIGQGTYNGTVWPTVEAGIRRQMQEAIAAAKSEGMEKVATARTNLLNVQGNVFSNIIKAQNDIIEAMDKRQVTVIELRNTVLKAMLDYIGAREDVYPQLQEISQTASQLGFSIGATGNFV